MHGMNNMKTTYCNSWVQRSRSPSYQIIVSLLAGHTLQPCRSRQTVRLYAYTTKWPVILTNKRGACRLTELTGYSSHNPHRLSSGDWWRSMIEKIISVLVLNYYFLLNIAQIRDLFGLSSKPIIKTLSVNIRSAEKIFLSSSCREHKP